jgi:diaminohydroxyphosphoribosylaminopyrimidine deaminase/5-amino-6-(5-phosphoribosylamino)uracil reductase
VLDGALRLPERSQLVASAKQVPVWVFCATDAPNVRERMLAEQGVTVIRTSTSARGLDLPAVLRILAERGLTRLMVEGGPKVAASLLRADLVDEAFLLHGPITIGSDGMDALDGIALDALTASPVLSLSETQMLGGDNLERYERR